MDRDRDREEGEGEGEKQEGGSEKDVEATRHWEKGDQGLVRSNLMNISYLEGKGGGAIKLGRMMENARIGKTRRGLL